MTFARLFVPDGLLAAVSDGAWVQAMLDAEAALARAEARAGVIPGDAAAEIAEHAHADRFDVVAIAEQGRAVANPAEPLVRALRAAVGGDAADYVHWGATSQDIVDTGAMLVAGRALGLVLAQLETSCELLAGLAEEHRSTPMAGRTMLQHAVPTTFGLKAAGWLVALVDAHSRLVGIRRNGLAAQLGGAAGTLAALGEHGRDVLRLYAEELELAEPVLPWHTNRSRIASIGSSLDLCAGVLAKIALDLILLAQTEVGEIRESADGGSSTMPQKRNPTGSALVRANARLVHAYASVLVGSLDQEHERAAGAWQAEWIALSGALAHTGGAAASLGSALEQLEVNPGRMLANLQATDGAIAAEHVSFLLSEQLGREEAHAVVRAASLAGSSLLEELAADERVGLSREQLEQALDPVAYLGSAEAFVDCALDLYRRWKDA